MTDFMDFQEELLSTTSEAMEYSKLYLEARKKSSHCFNQLQVLIQKANLHTSKKSPENKIIELMAHYEYGNMASQLNQEMLMYEAEYKGYELVIKTYLAHASALQSVIKQQVSGETLECVKNKYSNSRF